MADLRYRVIFTGKIRHEDNIEIVKQNLVNNLNIKEDVAEKFLSGNNITVKKDIDYRTALNIKEKLEQAGSLCEIEQIRANEAIDDTQKNRMMRCPRCGLEQKSSQECAGCGIVFSKYNKIKDSESKPGTADSFETNIVKTKIPANIDLRKPLSKPAVLFVITFGIYFPFWFYSTWKKLRDNAGIDINPARETLFLFIPIYDLFVIYKLLSAINDLARKENLAGLKTGMCLFMLVAPYLFFIIMACFRVDGPYWLAFVFSAWPLAECQRALNSYWETFIGEKPIGQLAMGWKVAVIVFLFLCGAFEAYLFIWNNTVEKDFASYTHEKIDALIISPDNRELLDISRTFNDYIMYSKSLMNDKRLYKKNAYIILKTALNRLARAISPYIPLPHGNIPESHMTRNFAAYRKMEEIQRQQIAMSGKKPGDNEKDDTGMHEAIPIDAQHYVQSLIRDNVFISEKSSEGVLLVFDALNNLESFKDIKDALPFGNEIR